MDLRTTDELEAAVLNGENVTPEQLAAANRIAELKAQREADIARREKEQAERVERAKVKHIEETRLEAEKAADTERRFTDGENLSCPELMELGERLHRQLTDAQTCVERYKIRPEQRVHLTSTELDDRERELKNAQTRFDSFASLHGQVCDILRTLPNNDKREYLSDLLNKIDSLEKREKFLNTIRSVDSSTFYPSYHKEFDQIGHALHALRQELDAADTRDRTSEGSLKNFQDGIKALVKAWRSGEIALHDAEILVRQVIAECECNAPLGQLFWSKATYPDRSPIDLFDDVNIGLDEAREAINHGAKDYLVANKNTTGFDPGVVFQNAIEAIFRTAVPEIDFKTERWWAKIWPNDPKHSFANVNR